MSQLGIESPRRCAASIGPWICEGIPFLRLPNCPPPSLPVALSFVPLRLHLVSWFCFRFWRPSILLLNALRSLHHSRPSVEVLSLLINIVCSVSSVASPAVCTVNQNNPPAIRFLDISTKQHRSVIALARSYCAGLANERAYHKKEEAPQHGKRE